jgi:AcrR family transcriptional regulator
MMSRKSTDTRARILESTWKLLENDTGNGVRMADIARAAGVSRQAVYLHFENRTDLLIATTRHIDEIKDIDARLAGSRAAKTGIDRLNAYICAWGNYIPEIYGVAKALLAMGETDAAARQAWDNRMQAMREGCTAAVLALDTDRKLDPDLSVPAATDLLWTLLSVRNWEHLVGDCGWPQQRYIDGIRQLAHRALLA